MELNKKTPKSLVHEFCAKERITPKWDSNEITKTPSKFKSCCMVPRPKEEDCLKAEGFGSTKKEAEHNASLELLAKLGYSLPKFSSPEKTYDLKTPLALIQCPAVTPSDTVTNGDSIYTDDVISDTDDNEIRGQEDPIGKLITLCRHFKLDLPKYTFNQRRGPANSNIFTVTCTIDSHVTITKCGKRLQKHKAQKIAALRVLREFENKYVRNAIRRNISNQTNQSIGNTSPGRLVKVDSTVSSMDVDDCKASGSPKLPELSDKTPQRKYEAFKVVYTAENPIRSMFTEILAHAQQEEAKKLMREEREREEIQVEATMERVKRKFEDEDVNSMKRWAQDMLDCGVRLMCPLQSNECLKYVKDFGHVFQHQTSNDKKVDNILIRKDFLDNLQTHGGPINFLHQTCNALKLKLMYRSMSLANNKKCVFIRIKIQFDLKNTRCNVLMVNGSADSVEEAKVNAAIEALKTIRLLVIDDI